MLGGMSDKRVALITGGSRRVGAAIVKRLVEAGYFLVFTYNRSAEEAEQVVSTHRGNAEAIAADLADPESAVEHIRSAFSLWSDHLDLLVNSASLYQPETDLDTAGRRRLMTVNFEAPVMLTRSFAPLLQRNGGCVVNMLDLLAERPWPAYATYCASKAALLNATISLARDLAPQARVNGISPGVVEWPEDYPLDEREKYILKVPLRRAGTPEDVAALVHFLATDGSYITGQNIRLDGGRSIA
jgi:pteridine reductase